MTNKNNDPNSFNSYNVIDSTEIKKNEKALEPEVAKPEEAKAEETVAAEMPKGPVPPPSYQPPQPQNVKSPPQNAYQAPPQNAYQVPPQNTYQAPPPQNTYQNPPPYSPQQNYAQNGAKVEKKPGVISSVVFWILLVVIGGFALLVDLTAKGYVGAGITVLVMAGIIFLKGKIIRKPIIHVLVWIVVTILLFVIMAVTIPKTGDTGGVSVNTNTLVQSGGVEVERAGFASAVDSNTLKPTELTDVFKPDATVVYYSLLIKKIPAGTSIKSTITYDKQVILEMEPSVFSEEIVNRYYTISIPRVVDQLLSEGQYTITLVGTNGDKEVLKMTDTFTVAK